MKDQYFGDLNDYRKYGLLRCLGGGGVLNTGVCWMLTPPDGRSDGSSMQYLRDPANWRLHDPKLFSFLQGCLSQELPRRLSRIEESDLFPATAFFREPLVDDIAGRTRYFERMFRRFEDRDLIFFDPDNGLEVKSQPPGRTGSSKYLYWQELTSAYGRGHSVLIYQHYPRRPRRLFAEQLATEILARTGAVEVRALGTPRMAFFLLAQDRHRTLLRKGEERLLARWGNDNFISSRFAA